MSKAPSMPLFCDAYLADTMALTLEQHGAYMKILMVTWRNNGDPLPDNDARMARILGVSPSRWKEKIRPALEAFFDLSEGLWRQKRLEKEWRFVQERASNSRENGKRGGRPKSLEKNKSKNPAGYFQETQREPTQSHTQSQQVEGVEETRARAIHPAVEIIRAFDAERIAAFGENMARPYPNQTDKIHADRWLAAGADLDLCRQVFHAVCQQFAAMGQGPPGTLSFFEHRIANAIAARNKPMPEGNPNDQRCASPQRKRSGSGWAAYAQSLASGSH